MRWDPSLQIRTSLEPDRIVKLFPSIAVDSPLSWWCTSTHKPSKNLLLASIKLNLKRRQILLSKELFHSLHCRYWKYFPNNMGDNIVTWQVHIARQKREKPNDKTCFRCFQLPVASWSFLSKMPLREAKVRKTVAFWKEICPTRTSKVVLNYFNQILQILSRFLVTNRKPQIFDSFLLWDRKICQRFWAI